MLFMMEITSVGTEILLEALPIHKVFYHISVAPGSALVVVFAAEC
jgi:hypothetical protein